MAKGNGSGGGGSNGGSGTSFTVKGTRGDDSNLTLPVGALLTQVTIDGSAGSDTLNLSAYGHGVSVQLISGYAKANSMVSEQAFIGTFGNYFFGADTVRGSIKNVESLVGTAFNDFLMVNIAGTAKRIDGGDGNDVAYAIGGNALQIGGSGNDWLPSYGAGNVLVGGTYDGSTAAGDDQTDYFYLGSTPVILDFETDFDHLILELTGTQTISDLLAGEWVAYGSDGASYVVSGIAEVHLAGVAPSLAETIQLDFALGGTGIIEGAGGDDMLFVGSSAPSHVVLGSASGDDLLISFDVLTDVLVFEDGIIPTWSDTMVNGELMLLGTWAGGSVTIEGLDTTDVPDLIIQGGAGSTLLAAQGPGAWSTDADFAAAALLAG